MVRVTPVTVLLGMVICLAAQPALAVIVFLKGQDQPIRGYLLRETDRMVVINQLLPNGTIEERMISRSEIDDMIQTVSGDRLEQLKPDSPDQYREYAEELAEKSKDPDARIASIRLFLIAAHLAPDRLGRSCLLGMVPLARSNAEQRRFRAMAYLLDPTHDSTVLTMPVETSSPRSDADPRQAEFMLRALRLLRQGKKRDALTQARRAKMSERLHELTDTISFDEFEQACEPFCPHCDRGNQKCPECGGNKFVRGVSCAHCLARGSLVCKHCGGHYREYKISPPLLKRIVQLELDWLPATEPVAESPRPPRASWSLSVQLGQSAPLPPLSLESLTELDPRQNLYRDGNWTSVP